MSLIQYLSYLALQASVLSDNYRFSAPKTDKHWQGIEDSLGLKITGKDLSSETIVIAPSPVVNFKKKKVQHCLPFDLDSCLLTTYSCQEERKHVTETLFFFLAHVGSDPQSEAKAFSVIYKSLHEMLPSTPKKVVK